MLSIFTHYKGAKPSPPREIVCSYFVLEAMDFAVGRLYVMKHFNDHSKKAVIINSEIQNLIFYQNQLNNKKGI